MPLIEKRRQGDRMSVFQNKEYLTKEQYKSPDNLQARIYIHQRYGTRAEGWTKWVYEQMFIRPAMSVLELGCGTGALWRDQGKKLPSDCRLVLSDMSWGMLAKTRSNIDIDCFPYQGDAQVLPFADASFDVIAAHHMLYHVSDLDTTLREIHRVLKPGGWLYAATNGLAHMSELYDLLRKTDTLIGGKINQRGSDASYVFGLETGIQPMERVFSHVERRDYQQHLEITEVQPLMDYILSMWGTQIKTDQALRECIQAEIDEKGFFFINKSQGMLIAQR